MIHQMKILVNKQNQMEKIKGEKKLSLAKIVRMKKLSSR